MTPRIKRRTPLAVFLALLLLGSAAWAEEEFVVDFSAPGESKAAEVKEKAAPKPTATPEAKKKPAEKLDDVDFDKEAAVDEGEEGLVIIAPGAASPEDSLAAFGIESPFNLQRKKLGAPEAGELGEEGTGEAIELNPEGPDSDDNVALESSEGEMVEGFEAYLRVERAGAVLSEEELRVDGEVVREKNARALSVDGRTLFLSMAEGRQVYPGAEYIIFRERGLVQPDSDREPVGVLADTVGVCKVLRVDTEWVKARVTKLYKEVQVGDKLRLRDPERQRYIVSLRGRKDRLAADLDGRLVGIKDSKQMASQDDIVYLDFGRAEGSVPGQRFMVFREAANVTDSLGIEPIGRIGLVEVIATRLKSSTARVLNMGTPLRVGDRIRYR